MAKKMDITTGTARIEPQFRADQNSKLLCTAQTWDAFYAALRAAQNSQEEVVNVSLSLRCYPLDGIVATNKALERTFGYVKAEGKESFFGRTPPQRISIQTGYDRTEQFAYGMLKPPSWEGGYINMAVQSDSPFTLGIHAQVKRKFEPSIRGVVKLAQTILREESIYRGAAVILDLNYIEDVEDGEGFNPEKCAPKFIDLSKPVKLILPREVERQIENNIWGVIRQPGDYRANGVPLKRSFLLTGVHGTGKSLTAAQTARVAADAGSTFFILKTPKWFERGYELAELYPPCVYFVEDVDEIFGGERDGRMNQLLETLDGVESKHNEIMTIFTTNYPEKIHKGFRRSGRIDRTILLTPFDGESAGRFIVSYAGDLLHPDVIKDPDVVGGAFDGLVGADIVNGITSAKMDAIRANGRNILGKVTIENLLEAAEEVQAEVREARGDTTTKAERELAVVRKAHGIVANGDEEQAA